MVTCTGYTQDPWPQRVSTVILEAEGVDAGVCSIANKLDEGVDYLDLSVEERLQVRSVCACACVCVLLAPAAACRSLLAPARPPTQPHPPTLRTPMQLLVGLIDIALGSRPENEPPSSLPSAIAGGGFDAARAWLNACDLDGKHRGGLLGCDARGRRYWCLGRLAGAFRVFVEDSELWGWYEGAGLGVGEA